MKTEHILLSITALLTLLFGANLHGASTLQFEYSEYSATEDTPSVLVAVLRSGDLTGPASVEVVSSDWSATAGEDHEAISLTMEFAEGEEVQTFRVPLLNDGIEEAAESFRLQLVNPSGGTTLESPTVAVITLEDNDSGVQFPWKHFWGYERDGQIRVTVERGNDVDLAAFTVNVTTSDLTAKAGLDYTAVSTTLEFAEGEMTQTITIPVADDEAIESREAFRITLSNSTGPGELGPNSVAEIWLHDTTGHQPRRFGTAELVGLGAGQARLSAPLSGRSGGDNSRWVEIFGVESSGDLRTWEPESWLGIASPELPGTFQDRVGATDRRFFRPNTAALLAAWPPPESSKGAFADRETAVGYTERWVTDSTRRNRYGISDNSAFRVSIWYPASLAAGAVPRPFLSPDAARFWLDTWEYPPDSPSPDVVTYSFEHTAFRTGDTKHPIILYSHAGNPWTSGAREIWNHAEYLALQGFVVAVPHHYDCWETPLPDGSFYAVETVPERSAAGFQDRMRDFEVLLDAMAEWQVSDPLLAGRLDLANMASMGYQWGVGVATELCRTVDVCRAGVLLHIVANSWTGVDTPLAAGLDKPMMFIQESTNSRKDLYAEMEADAVWFQLAGGTFDSLFAWYPWNNALYPDRPSDQNVIDGEVCRTIQAYVASFLKNKLGLDDDTLWEGPSEDHPRVIRYDRK